MDYWGGGGGGGQRVCWPPLSNYWGGPGPPSSYAYGLKEKKLFQCHKALCNFDVYKCFDLETL